MILPADATSMTTTPARPLGRTCDDWSDLPLSRRLAVIRRFRRSLVLERDAWIDVATPEWRADRTQTLSSELIPLADAARFLECQAPKLLKIKKLGRSGRPFWLSGTAAEIHHDPIGWVMILAPSNYPLMLPGVQVLQALAAGNSVALKPSPLAYAAAARLVEVLHRCGVPQSALRLLNVDPATARLLYPEVDKVVLTGSHHTGRAVLRDLADHLVPAAMELSGVDAMVVLPRANLNLAARALLFGLTFNASATCIAPRRVYVVGDAQPLIDRLDALIAEVPAMELHPGAATALRPLIERAQSLGARFIGDPDLAAEGYPVVITGLPADADLFDQGLMAPIATISEVRTQLLAAEAVNQSRYGLGASIFGPAHEAESLATRLDVGMVTINDLIVPSADPRLPFGGRKLSGFGVTRGAEGLMAMTRQKVVTRRSSRGIPVYLDEDSGKTADAALPALFDLTHGPDWRCRWRGLKRLISLGPPKRGAQPDGETRS
ncbi:MAG: aldehyde dehydrogenase family protein [Phycisphaeraceae bacterium]